MTTRQSSTSSSTDPPARREAVLGVDTHGEVHVAAVISPLGKVLGTESFPATAAGYRQLLVRARKRGTVRRAGVEGTGTFGAGLSRYLLAQQVQVYEVNRPDRSARRLMGKSDPIDAEAAARAVLSGRARARAKSGDGPVHSARIFKLAKDSAVKARTQAINQLKAVLVIADPALRERLSSLGNAELFRTCATLSPPDGGGDEDAVAQATHMTLRMLAERVEQLTGQIDELNQRLTRLVERHAPPAARAGGHRPGQRRPSPDHHGSQPRATEHRGVLCCPLRSQPHRVLLRPAEHAPAQPRRRPPGQRRPAPHRLHPAAPRPPHPGVLRTPHAGGQDPL